MSATNASRDLGATLGRNIQRARKAAGLTQHALAIKLGRGDAMSISRWERGASRPNDENLFALADALGCDVAWFFADHDRVAA